MQQNPSEIFPYPTGILKFLVRLPIHLYRWGFGPLLGWLPFIVLTTRGRKSNLPRHVVLEYRRHGSKYYVVSGWGKRPHWYQNLLADPTVTIQYGGTTLSAQAVPVDNPAEAMKALYMFRRNSPIYEVILAMMSSADTIDMRTLTDVSDEFTVVRLEPNQNPVTLPGIETRNPWLAPLILIALLGFIISIFLSWRGDNPYNSHHTSKSKAKAP